MKHDGEPIKSKYGKTLKIFVILLDKSMHSSRAVCALWSTFKLSSTAPPLNNDNNNNNKKYRSKSTKLNHWLREQQPKNCVKIRWADIISCVVLLVIWDRKASNLPPSPPPFNPQSEKKKMMKREDSEKAEISNNSSDKWKWFNDLLPVFFHSDNLHEARSSRMSKF